MRVACLVALALPALARAAPPADPTLVPLADDAIPLGSDYLTFRPLAHSVVDATGGRITFDAGGTRLVLLVEPTALAGGDLARAVTRANAREPARVRDARVEPLALASGLRAVAVAPRAPARSNELLYAAYVANPVTGAVVRLAFYVEADDDSARDLSWRATAERIARTADLPFETVAIAAWTVQAPAGTTAEHRGRIDVVRVTPDSACALGTDVRTRHGIEPAHVAGVVLGTAVDWEVWEHATDTETTAVGDLHLACEGRDARAMALLRYVASTLTPASSTP